MVYFIYPTLEDDCSRLVLEDVWTEKYHLAITDMKMAMVNMPHLIVHDHNL